MQNYPYKRNASFRSTMLVFVLCFILAGCSTPHLKEQTISVGHSVGSIYTSQVLENLYNIADERNAIPSHFSFSKGSIATASTINPSVSVPIGETRTQGLIAATGNLGVTQLVGNSQGIVLGASEGWNQSWDIAPEKDPTVLNTLNILYNYSLGNIDNTDNRLNELRPVPLRPSPRKIAGMTPSSSCSLTVTPTSIKCQAPQETKPSTELPSRGSKEIIGRLLDNCVGCFKQKSSGLSCIEPKDVPMGAADKILDPDTWVCLGIYNSIDERLVGHEMMIKKRAYMQNALLDLVVLSLQLQSDAAKASASKSS